MIKRCNYGQEQVEESRQARTQETRPGRIVDRNRCIGLLYADQASVQHLRLQICIEHYNLDYSLSWRSANLHCAPHFFLP